MIDILMRTFIVFLVAAGAYALMLSLFLIMSLFTAV